MAYVVAHHSFGTLAWVLPVGMACCRGQAASKDTPSRAKDHVRRPQIEGVNQGGWVPRQSEPMYEAVSLGPSVILPKGKHVIWAVFDGEHPFHLKVILALFIFILCQAYYKLGQRARRSDGDLSRLMGALCYPLSPNQHPASDDFNGYGVGGACHATTEGLCTIEVGER